MTTAALTIEQLLAMLPHRYPMLLIDRVLELSADHVVAIKNVAIDEPWVAAHVPGLPIMPAVLQLEAMAQAGVLLATHAAALDPAVEVIALLAIDAARFRRPVAPGDQLHVAVRATRKGSLLALAGEIRVDGAVASTAKLVVGRVARAKLA